MKNLHSQLFCEKSLA